MQHSEGIRLQCIEVSWRSRRTCPDGFGMSRLEEMVDDVLVRTISLVTGIIIAQTRSDPIIRVQKDR